MTVAIPLTTPAPVAERLPSLWELGQELQDDSRWVAQLAERLDTDDESERARAIADLEQTLAAEQHSRQAFTRKADATCWVIGRLRAEASYHEQQSKWYAALARNEEQRATALESTLIHWLTRLDPAATRFRLIDHQLSSRLTDAVTIDDPDALPPDLVTLTTTRTTATTAARRPVLQALREADAADRHCLATLRPAGFSPEQINALAAPLDRRHISQREQGRSRVAYLQSWWLICEANRIFGFDGWQRQTLACRCIHQGEQLIGRDQKPGWGVTYTARAPPPTPAGGSHASQRASS